MASTWSSDTAPATVDAAAKSLVNRPPCQGNASRLKTSTPSSPTERSDCPARSTTCPMIPLMPKAVTPHTSSPGDKRPLVGKARGAAARRDGCTSK
eukprot:3503735-Prymnesium_polylepis.2